MQLVGYERVVMLFQLLNAFVLHNHFNTFPSVSEPSGGQTCYLQCVVKHMLQVPLHSKIFFLLEF